MKEYIRFEENRVEKISLYMGSIEDNSNVVLSGWGYITYPSDVIPDKLQFIELKTIDNDKCSEALNPLKVEDTNICTFTKIGEGACKGDSGGPLVYEYQLAGIVSWGNPCATGVPDVFTRVSSYYDWIIDQFLYL